MKTEAPQMERPAIFNAAMVRAILEDRKTQARRVVRPQPNKNGYWTHGKNCSCDDCGEVFSYTPERCRNCHCTVFKRCEYPIAKCLSECPYGRVGDRLWVRETWAIRDCGSRVKITAGEITMKHRLQYPATDKAPATNAKGEPHWWNKRPSIHMPRWASRITLEITKVRVERLQDISEEDAKAEGVVPSGRRATHRYRASDNEDHGHRLQFQDLWNSINGAGAWDKNPWVWCISFQRHLTGNVTKSDNAMGASS